MKFSIILPIYNVEAYLKECIDSILQQTYSDYEIILVNDGSNDRSPSICEEYALIDKRIKVFHQENSGQSAARNKGLAIASGEYVVFIDSDDFIISKAFLQKLADKTKEEVDVCFFKYCKYWESSKELCNCTFSYKCINGEGTKAWKIQQLVDADAFYGMAWIKAVRKAVLVDNNIKFEEGRSAEDTDWNYNLLLYANRIDFIDEPFLAYRQRVGSVSHSLKLENLIDFICVISKWSRIFKKLEDESLRKALLSSLSKYYFNLLIVYIRVADKRKRQQILVLKDLSWLLKYSRSKRPIITEMILRLLGFNITIIMLSLLDRIRNEKARIA